MHHYRKHNININKLRTKFNSRISDTDIRSAVQKVIKAVVRFIRDIAKTLSFIRVEGMLVS